MRPSWRAYVVWTKLFGLASARCRNCGQNLTRDQAPRYPGGAADQVRACHQPQDREDAGPHSAADAARYRRRVDRMSAIFSRQLLFVIYSFVTLVICGEEFFSGSFTVAGVALLAS